MWLPCSPICLKKALTSLGLRNELPCLQAHQFSLLLTSLDHLLATDASDVGVGSVLLQEDDQNVDHPVCYFPKKLNCHQQNYSTVEKEALALLLALQHFKVYLEAAAWPIVVYTDHNPLVFVQNMRNTSQRLLRWSLALQEFDVDIHHIKGKDNLIADALPRCV